MRTEVRHDGAEMVVLTHVGREGYETDPAPAQHEHDTWIAAALVKRIAPNYTYTIHRRPCIVYSEDAQLARRNEIALITGFTIEAIDAT